MLLSHRGAYVIDQQAHLVRRLIEQLRHEDPLCTHAPPSLQQLCRATSCCYTLSTIPAVSLSRVSSVKVCVSTTSDFCATYTAPNPERVEVRIRSCTHEGDVCVGVHPPLQLIRRDDTRSARHDQRAVDAEVPAGTEVAQSSHDSLKRP